MRILTNHPGQKESETWRRVSEYVPDFGGGLWASINVALRLHRRKAHCDAVVLGAGRSDLIFAIIQTLIPVGQRPCVMIDCLWYKRKNPLVQSLKKVLRQLADRSVDKYVVWASREIEAYASAFNLDRRKFCFVPYHTTLFGHDLEPSDGGYLFSGGNFGRDYGTLLQAVDGLPCKLLIASNRSELFSGLRIPSNVEVKSLTHHEYLRAMAGCAINIVPLAPHQLHSGGQQTFLNSMSLGKPTIVTDPEGAADYIEHGVDGLLVEPSNPGALRQSIEVLRSDQDGAREMGRLAAARAGELSTEEHFKRILTLVEDCARSCSGAP